MSGKPIIKPYSLPSNEDKILNSTSICNLNFLSTSKISTTAMTDSVRDIHELLMGEQIFVFNFLLPARKLCALIHVPA